MTLAHQIKRKPSQHEIQQVVGTKMACAYAQNERCRKISAKPPVPAAEPAGSLPRGIHLIHAGSHSRLISPIPMNTGRQPYLAITIPAPKVPTAFPHLNADAMTPLANPRWYSGRCRARIFEHDGNATDSPMPSSTSTGVKVPKLRASSVG